MRLRGLLMSALLLVGVLGLTFSVAPVGAGGGTFCIRADGSVDPPGAPISSVDNVTYTFTADIYDSIVVERSNIVVDGAGYAVQGTGSGNGIDLSSRSNVTVKNTTIRNFYSGIYLTSASKVTLIGNNITANNGDGIFLSSGSDNNSISGNNITANNWAGIHLSFWSNNNSISANNITNNWAGILFSRSSNNIISGNSFVNNGLRVLKSYGNVVSDNLVNGKPLVYLEGVSDRVVEEAGQVVLVRCSRIRVENLNLSSATVGVELWETSNTEISGNNITANNYYGIGLDYSSNNSISGNNITNNECGIRLDHSSNNSVYHNNFVDNARQVFIDSPGYPNCWDDGYPSGGNHWSDYNGTDLYSGPYQNETGSDGIGDTPYIIDADNRDRYPLMKPWPDVTPPNITILSPGNMSYTTTSVPLTFAINERCPWMGYSLDNQANVTITGNTTLTGLSDGPHNVVVYANDTSGNMGSSHRVYFTVALPPPPPPAVGGIVIPVNKLGLFAPEIVLGLLILSSGVAVFIKHRKKQE